MHEPSTQVILDALLSFREAVELRFTAIDNRFTGVDSRFDGIDSRLDGIDSRLDRMDRHLDRIDRRLDGHDARFVSLESTMSAGFTAVCGRLDRLEAQRT